MLKLIHIVFVLLSLVGFIGRVTLSEFNAEISQQKPYKILPHVVDTLLLLSGLALVLQGAWLNRENGWIISKLLLLSVYILFGTTTMRSSGNKRWLAFSAAIVCYTSIFIVAISKQGFI